VRVAARSLKYHRPRGLFCLAGRCMSCLARVDGVPNVRTCHVACRDGMNVLRENAIPQANDDLLFAFDYAFPKHLAYYEMFTKPAWMNKLLQRSVLAFAGTGDLPDKPIDAPPIRERSVEALVIGGGPAGLAAAMAAAQAGAKVALVEDAPELGGHWVGWAEKVDGEHDGPAWIAAQKAALAQVGVELMLGAECLGRYREGFWAVHQGGALTLLTAQRTILATGAYDRPPLFPNNDLPNIFSARAMMKLTNRWGICPAVACTIIGTDDAALSLAERLPEIGVRVLGLVTESTKIDGDADRAERIQSRGVPVFLGYRVTRAIGSFHLKGLRLEPVGGGEAIDARCDLVCASLPPSPSWELAAQAGAEVAYAREKDGFAAQADACGRTPQSDVFVTGEMLGAAAPAEIVRRGRAAGLAAALDLRPDSARQAELKQLTEN
jgi:sarcosine oxidase subunit alpha